MPLKMFNYWEKKISISCMENVLFSVFLQHWGQVSEVGKLVTRVLDVSFVSELSGIGLRLVNVLKHSEIVFVHEKRFILMEMVLKFVCSNVKSIMICFIDFAFIYYFYYKFSKLAQTSATAIEKHSYFLSSLISS